VCIPPQIINFSTSPLHVPTVFWFSVKNYVPQIIKFENLCCEFLKNMKIQNFKFLKSEEEAFIFSSPLLSSNSYDSTFY
jgi:hypothetical protein